MTTGTAYRHCQGCQGDLTGRQRCWCSEECRERHRGSRPGRKNYHGARTRQQKHPLRYAGLDGESVDNRYILLALATDDGHEEWVENEQGLTTFECLNFLCGLDPKLRKWGFAFGYDINKMLWQVSQPLIRRLHETGRCYWHNFLIKVVPGKQFQVTQYEGRGDDRVRVGGCTIWDMFTWQQSSFVNWIEKWSLASSSDIEQIRSMKAQRSTFGADQHEEIRRYCLSECRFLAAGARRLCDLVFDAGIAVSSWYSPATISKALLKRNHVMEHRAAPPAAIEHAVDAAYHGGRAELAQIGPVKQTVYSYDIRSAYPTEAVNLPCLACGRWRHVKRRKTIENYSLVFVRWKPRHARQKWGGLPVKPRTGSLRWPLSGEGWFWGVEARAAQRHLQIEVVDHWVFDVRCEHQPFAYLNELYVRRAALKAEKDPTEYVLKIALNATYGALAEHPHVEGEEPKYRCLVWAGLITAGTRARLLDALTDDVLMMATDGILSLAPLPLEPSEDLGGWECATYEEMWLAGTGVYFGRQGDEWVTTKTRGFEPGQLDLDQFRRLWAKHGKFGRLDLVRSRFIGYGTALHRLQGFEPPSLRLWGQFIDEDVKKSLDLEPRRTWLNRDVRDGRTRAPSKAQAARLAALDRRKLKELHARYAKSVTFRDNYRTVLASPRGPAHAAYLERKVTEYEQRVLRDADRILKMERREGSSVFDWADDPSL